MLKHQLLQSDEIWVTEFTDDALQEFYLKFMDLENDPSVGIISVIISSYGGDITIMNAMRDIIQSSPKPVATTALGKAMSAGITLLAAGSKGYRFASPNTELMFHELSTMHRGKATEIHNSAINTVGMNKLMIKNFGSDTGNDAAVITEKIKSLGGSDWFLTPSDAQKWGIIDHIEIPRATSTQSLSHLAILKPTPTKSQKPKKKA